MQTMGHLLLPGSYMDGLRLGAGGWRTNLIFSALIMEGALLLLSYLVTFSAYAPAIFHPFSDHSCPVSEIVFEYLPFFRLYKSGCFERLSDPTFLPPSPCDPTTGVASKDVIIDPVVPVSARLYLPPMPPSTPSKLPLLFYFHGGAFCFESAFSPLYHSYINSLAAHAGVVIVSVQYRLAPENPVPAAYEDCWAAIRWATAGSDPWIAQHADLNRIFFAGDSAGANIAHRMAVRAGAQGEKGVEGTAAIHPYFSTGVEKDKVWQFVCPEAVKGTADPRIYPAADKEAIKGMAGRRLLVFVAEADNLRKAGEEYYEVVKESGWGGVAELVETKGEGHVFHLHKPESKKAMELMETLAAFLRSP